MGKLRQTQTAIGSTATSPAGAGRRGKPSPPSVQDRTAAVARGIVLVLSHHDCPGGLIRDCLDQVSEVLNTALDERIWVKRLKNLLARPLAQYLKNELPPDSDVVFKPQGAFRRWFRNRLNAFNDKNTHLWYSWFQMKRCCLPSSEDFISNTYKEHKASLTAPDPGDDLTIDRVFLNPVFLDVLNHIKDSLPPYFDIPSSSLRSTQSACFGNTRGEGGQFAKLRDLAAIPDHYLGYFKDVGYGANPHHELLELDYYRVPFTSDLFRMDFYTKVLYNTNVVVTTREPYGRDEWVSLDAYEKEPIFWPKHLRCEIKGVVEPLKIRVISKGEPLAYYSQRKLQRALHDTMRIMPPFRLIGRPFCPTDLMDLKEVASETDQWFSVDYSAATDGLSWKFSSRILAYLLRGFPPEMSRALKVLGPHELYYPQLKKGRWVAAQYEATQVNGQLMGSILSFPILCLANLATYLLTMEDLHREKELCTEEVLQGVLINGDDMVYPAPKALWERHKEISEKLGLKMSVGKAYVHPRYANINSTSVSFDLSKSGTPREIPYLNVGLFFQSPVQKKEALDEAIAREERDLARVKSGLAKSHHDTEGIVACINKLTAGALNEKKLRIILMEYISMHQETIKDETLSYLIVNGRRVKHHRNLFTPISVGGMGILPPTGWRFKVKKIERVLAANLMAEFPCDLDFARPLRGFELKEALPVDCPWVKPQTLPEPPCYEIKSLKWKSSRFILRSGFFVSAPNRSVRLVREDPVRSYSTTTVEEPDYEVPPVEPIKHFGGGWRFFIQDIVSPLFTGEFFCSSHWRRVLERR